MNWMANARGNFVNSTNTRPEGEMWITWDATTGLPSLHRKLRTHAAVTKGVPYMFQVTAAYPGGLTAACATNVRAYVAFANETKSAAAYVDCIVAGYVEDAAASGTIASDANVEVINSGVAVIDDGSTTTQTANTLGHALGAAASNLVDIWVYESPIAIAAS